MSPGIWNLIDRIRALMRPEEGQDLVEYCLVIALLATGATAGMKSLANVLLTALINLNTTFGNYTL